MRFPLRFVLALTLLFPLVSVGHPVDSIFTITESKDFFPLNKTSFLLKDNQGKLKIDSILKSDSKFELIEEEIYNLNADKNVKAYWLRCTFQNLTHTELKELLCFHPGIDTIEIFIFNPDHTSTLSRIFTNQATTDRPVYISQVLSVPITLQQGVTKVYVRFANFSKWSREMASIIFSLAEEKRFLNYFLEVRFYQGLMLGMIALIIVFHIFIYIFFKDTTYLIFLINVVLTLIYLLLRKNYQLEFSFLSPLFGALTYLHDPLGVLISLTAVWFSQSFLSTRETDPNIHKLMNVLKAVLGIIALCMLSWQLLPLMNLLSISIGIISTSVVIVASIRSYRRGNRLALYVFFGFILLALIPVIYLVPIPNYLHYKTSETDLHYFGEAIRSIIFAVGITDRFYQLKKEVTRVEVEKEQLKFERERKIQEEKERIARDLHDNIGSQLVVLALELSNPTVHKTEDPEIASLRQSINTIINRLRDTVWVLENDEVTIKDLEGKINTMMFLYRKKIYGFDFKLHVPDEIKSFQIKPTQANHVFRIIQEGVQNAVQHSKGKNIEVIFSLEFASKTLTIKILDDGTGYKDNANQSAGDIHYGVKNMQKRATEINGSLTIEMRSSGGTEVILHFPLE